MNKIKGVIGVSIVLFGLFIMTVAGCGLVGRNDAQNWTVLQSITGNLRVVDNPGYFWKGFGKTTVWPRAMEMFYSHDGEGPTGDQSIRVTFNDAGTAQVSSYVRITLPLQEPKRLELHRTFSGNTENLVHAVRSHLINCVKATGPLMSATENQTSRKAEFNQLIEEQLMKGLYKMRRVERELKDQTILVEENAGEIVIDGKEIEKKVVKEQPAIVQATEVINDTKNGQPLILRPSPLETYDIQILQFSVTETEYDPKTLEQFSAKKESYLMAEQAKAKRQEEVQQALMIKARGLRLVAEIEAIALQEKKKATVAAEREAEVAVIKKDQAVTEALQKVEVAAEEKKQATTMQEIAEIKVETAELEKKAAIATAEGKQKQIEIGGSLSEAQKTLATLKVERDSKVAQALAQIRTPGVLIMGGKEGEKGGDLQSNLLNLTMLKFLGILNEKEDDLFIPPKPVAQPKVDVQSSKAPLSKVAIQQR